MRNFVIAAVAVVVVAGNAKADDEKDVRDLSVRYARAAVARDRAGMERLLHPDYQGVRMPVRAFKGGGDDVSRAEVVAAWTGPTTKYSGLEYKTEAVRVSGTTAVETRCMWVTVGPLDSPYTRFFRDVRYVRVWVKHDAGWRVFHESY